MNAQAAVVHAQQPSAMVAEPPAFRENWKRVLGFPGNDEKKFIRISNGVASVCNERLVLRYPIAMPDGFYLLSSQNELFPAAPYGWLTYPDFEQIRPPFEKVAPLSVITREALVAFGALCDGARQNQATILADERGMCWVQNHQHNVSYPLGLKGDGLKFEPQVLKMALVEMMRYDQVYLWKEERLDFSATPLVLGLDWGHCALIESRAGSYNYWG